ncbi:hypothetical protein FOMPIDRAFT_1020253 [Fomitopsis schrenkii]|uniref:Cullin family profile domain-containing protein n=1 Tax=Fomitopsis schrenkii TaxID=2126942 RepID=S8EWX1_FOMSC|nr:hypothetical protein FOMPIDRAFT_1020253 [Fomitopsis schrenkii]
MWDNFQELLDYDKDEDLQRMYALLARISEGLEPLCKRFEEHVKRSSLTAVSKLVGQGGADAVDPKAYVDALLEVHSKNSETVTQSFRGEAGFVVSLDKACREFVNKNDATGTSTTRSPELLAKHADALLRKNNKMAEEEDLEGALNKVMVLFKYIDDKDVFQTYHTMKLSKRLIHGVAASDEAEASMISKLKEACGFEYTNKLQCMFTGSHRERVQQNHDDMDLNFSIMVLGTNFWPLNPTNSEFIIPTDILPTYERCAPAVQQPGHNKAESSKVQKIVDEDHKYVIQVTIVRIMKARKQMKNQALVQEVISQISQCFTPKLPDINKEIEHLPEKEYERVDGTRDTFAYVA